LNVLIMPSWYPTSEKPLRGIFFKEQAEALARADVHVSVLYFNFYKRSTLKKNLFVIFPRISIRMQNNIFTVELSWFYPLNHHSSKLIVEFLFALIGFFIVATHGKPDLIHVQSVVRAGYVARIISRIFGIPYIISEHSSKYERYGVLEKKLLRIREVFLSSQLNIVVAPALAQILGKTLGIDPLSFMCIPNSINTDFFTIGEKTKKSIVITSICYLSPNKGVEILLRGFVHVLNEVPDAKLLIAGDGTQRTELEILASDLGIRESAVFLGQLDRSSIRNLLHDTSVYVSTSYVETFGVTLIEALAAGVPVVATRSGGPNTIVTDTVGLLVPIGNPIELSKAILKIIENYNSYSPDSIRSYCIENFGDGAVTSRLVKVYSNLIESPV